MSSKVGSWKLLHRTEFYKLPVFDLLIILQIPRCRKRNTGRKIERDMPILRLATQPAEYALTMVRSSKQLLKLFSFAGYISTAGYNLEYNMVVPI